MTHLNVFTNSGNLLLNVLCHGLGGVLDEGLLQQGTLLEDLGHTPLHNLPPVSPPNEFNLFNFTKSHKTLSSQLEQVSQMQHLLQRTNNLVKFLQDFDVR